MGISDAMMRDMRIFMPHNLENIERISRENKRFVHYTSGSVGLSILREEEVWMRKARCMNDFSEVQYGLDCLNKALERDTGNNFFSYLQEKFQVGDDLLKLINSWIPYIIEDSYITCISEHEETESENGRLSMWRAYGGKNSVALILSHEALTSDSDALKVYTSPVAYLSEDQFFLEFDRVFQGIRDNEEYIRSMQRDQIIGQIFNLVAFAMLCTKHPGFSEEREWRVVYVPKLFKSNVLKKELQVVRDVPQIVYKIPLKDIEEEGLTGIEVGSLVEGVIIGPCEFPDAMREAFVEILAQKGVQHADDIVRVSGIPLR